MKAFIVDSSVAAKWLPPLSNEPLASEARGLLADWTRGKIELSVPDLLLIEVANVRWKATRAGRCKAAEARAALKILISYDLPVAVSATFLGMTLRIAIAYERTVCDSLYVALAVQSGRELIAATRSWRTRSPPIFQ